MSRRHFLRSVLGAGLTLLVSLVTGKLAAQPRALGGRCHEYRCSCPGFQGSGFTCTRGGCGHHYDRHY